MIYLFILLIILTGVTILGGIVSGIMSIVYWYDEGIDPDKPWLVPLWCFGSWFWLIFGTPLMIWLCIVVGNYEPSSAV